VSEEEPKNCGDPRLRFGLLFQAVKPRVAARPVFLKNLAFTRRANLGTMPRHRGSRRSISPIPRRAVPQAAHSVTDDHSSKQGALT